MNNYEILEFQKKIIIKYSIPIGYLDDTQKITIFDYKTIKVRFNKKENNESSNIVDQKEVLYISSDMIALKDSFYNSISKKYGIKKLNIVVKFDSYIVISNYLVNMIPCFIIFQDKSWIRNKKINELLYG